AAMNPPVSGKFSPSPPFQSYLHSANMMFRTMNAMKRYIRDSGRGVDTAERILGRAVLPGRGGPVSWLGQVCLAEIWCPGSDLAVHGQISSQQPDVTGGRRSAAARGPRRRPAAAAVLSSVLWGGPAVVFGRLCRDRSVELPTARQRTEHAPARRAKDRTSAVHPTEPGDSAQTTW